MRGLYRGVVPGVAGIVPAAAVYMLVYQSLRPVFVAKFGERWRSLGVASAAGLGDVAASFVRVPCEVAKQRLQVGVYKDSGEMVREMGRILGSGPKGLYAGLGAQLARDVPFVAAEFVVYDALKRLVEGVRGERKGDLLGVGAVSGIVAAVVSNPSDVVKTRLMTMGGYAGVGDAFGRIAREEGIRAFGKGLAPRIVSKSLQSACFFTTYEAFKSIFAKALDVEMKAKAVAAP